MNFDLESLRAGYARAAFKPCDVAAEALKRIAAYRDPSVWISRTPEDAVMARARALEANAQAHDLPLYGVPFAVKDNIDAVGLPTTAACPAYSYAPKDSSAVVGRLLAAGAILIGKTNLDQFATGLVGTRSPYGAPACVFDDRYISGGSSSGSAVSVAAGLVSFALGTDTAGSGRVPAMFNNIVGLKPTRGLISTRGVVPACKSLDCVSIFANTVSDADRIAHVVEGFDEADPFSRKNERRTLPRGAFRFGVLRQEDRGLAPALDALYEDAIRRVTALGGTPVAFAYEPFAAAAALLYGGPYVAERYAAIKDFVEQHDGEMDPTVRKIIAGARNFSAADAFEAHYKLAALKRESDAQWNGMDVMLLPTAPTQFTFEEIAVDPIGRNAALGRFTNFVNLLDYCAIAVPAGFCDEGLAFGVTLIAPAFADRALTRLAERLQRMQSFGMGADRTRSLPAPSQFVSEDPMIELFVVGAHLSGMPLNRELVALKAEFSRKVRTLPDYRLFVLPNTTPPKPGLIRAPGSDGPGIEGEVWSLLSEAFGEFVSRIPAPLGIGKVSLDDGTQVSGFLCEAFAVEGAQEITALGGWRAYIGDVSK